jgi:deoxyribose-phosphate aldolase
MRLSAHEIPRLIDISAVRTDVMESEVRLIAEMAIKYNFVCAFAMPCYTATLVEILRNHDSIGVGGVVGFPSGADTTQIKVETARALLAMGCDELDMVVNVGQLKSGNHDAVYEDIRAVVKAAGDTPVKSILEIAYLTDQEIMTGSRIAADAGVVFVKTGTGWADKPTTVRTIELIRQAIGERALIKAAGGVRTLHDLESMYEAGCSRFGISATSALKILNEAYQREGLALD